MSEVYARDLCKEIGNAFGTFFEDGGALCIDNGDKVFRYGSEKELLADWVDTLVSQQVESSGDEGCQWEDEIRYIYNTVLCKSPKGVRIRRAKGRIRFVAEVYRSDGSPHGKMLYLGTFDSMAEAIYATWNAK